MERNTKHYTTALEYFPVTSTSTRCTRTVNITDTDRYSHKENKNKKEKSWLEVNVVDKRRIIGKGVVVTKATSNVKETNTNDIAKMIGLVMLLSVQ
jgi:hypothetical protein